MTGLAALLLLHPALGATAPEPGLGSRDLRIRELRVVVESAAEVVDQDVVLREIYGPEPLMIVGGAHGAPRRN